MNPPKKILMVSGNVDGPYDGVTHYTHRLLETLSSQTQEFRFFLLGRRSGILKPLFSRKKTYQVFSPHRSWPARFDLAGAVAKWIKPDLIHFQEEAYAFFHSPSPAKLAQAAKCPVITTLHEFHLQEPDFKHTKDLLNQSQYIISNDERNSLRCKEHLGRSIDLQLWSGSNIRPLQNKITTKKFQLVTFGHLSLRDLSAVFQALERLKKIHPLLHWKIIGPFTPESKEEHAKLAQLLDREWIEFTGAYDDVDDLSLREQLSNAHIMLLPYTDGASTRRGTLQAAWAFGLPVITTPPTTSEASISNNQNCKLVNLADSTQWEQAIADIFFSESLETKLRQGSLANAQKMSWSNLAAEHLQVYRKLSSSN